MMKLCKELIKALVVFATFFFLSIYVAYAQNVVFFEDFEDAVGDSESNTNTLNGLPEWNYKKTNSGRLRTSAGDDFYYRGRRAITLDAVGIRASKNYLEGHINLGKYKKSPNLFLSFAFMHHGDESHSNDRVWVKSAAATNWVEVYNLDANKGAAGVWNEVKEINISNVLAGQPKSSYVDIRFGQEDNARAVSKTRFDGFSFDDIGITESPASYSNLVYWLRADAGVFEVNSITKWDDQTSNDNDAFAKIQGPDLVTSVDMNNQKALLWNGARGLNIKDNDRINTGFAYQGDKRSMFIAFKTGDDINTNQYIYEQGGKTNGLVVYIKNDTLYVNIYNDYAVNRIVAKKTVTANTAYVLSFIWDNGTLRGRLNNSPFDLISKEGTIASLSPHTGDISVGYTDAGNRDETGSTTNPGNHFKGQIAEILYYDSAIDAVNEIEINNNLGEKYGIDVSTENSIFYSYQSGNWNDISTWTHDPGGTTHTATDIPNSDDWVVVLQGRTVTLNSNVDTSNLEITIREDGRLDQSTFQFTSGIKILRGQGVHTLASTNYPQIVKNEFVNKEGGTTEYNNSHDFILPSTQNTYNNLVINTANTVTQLSNLKINGYFYVKKGTYQINNNTSRTKLNLTIEGNVIVDAGASWIVGKGSTNTTTNPNNISSSLSPPFINYYEQFHRVVVKGDFTNNGMVRFTNLNYPIFNALPPTNSGTTSGAASVYFMGTTDNTLNCNGTTDFYNLILDKGIDKTYKLVINSTNYHNFRLFGANSAAGDIAGNVTMKNPNLKKALWIRTGTLELKGLTIIPSLSEGGGNGSLNSDFYIPMNAALVLNGSEVVVLTTADSYKEVNLAYGISANPGDMGINVAAYACSFSVLGKLQINKGYISTRESGGIITWGSTSGLLEINGGIVDAKQFRSDNSGSGLAAFHQTGGLLLLRGRFQRTPSAYTSITNLKDFSLNTLNTQRKTKGLNGSMGTFNMNGASNIFDVSGGTIRIYDVSGINPDRKKAVEILADKSNIRVTGGMLELVPITGDSQDSDQFKIISTAPFWNFTVNRASSASTIDVNTHKLDVLNNLNLISGTLKGNNLDVSIGGNFEISNGATYNPGNNWTIFNGDKNQVLKVNTTNEFSFKKLKIDKPENTTLTIEGSQTNISVQDYLKIENATLDDNGHIISIKPSTTSTTSYLYNSGVHKGTGAIILADEDPQVITGDDTGIFQNLKLNNTDGLNAAISTDADITIKGQLSFLQDNILNIGINNLKLDKNATIVNANSDRYIQTSGKSSDKGISQFVNANKLYKFPIGVSGKYTPIEVDVTNISDDGYIQISVADKVLATTNPAGGGILSYYWRVRHNDFTTLPNVHHKIWYNQSDVSGNEATFVQGKVLDYNPYTRSVPDGNLDITNNTIEYNPTVLENANYTAGEPNQFTGNVLVYYTRNISSGWRDGAWTRSDIITDIDNNGTIDDYEYHDSRQPAINDFPKAGDIAVIGWVPWGDTPEKGNQGEPHGVWIQNRTEECAELIFTQMKDINGNPTTRVYRSNFQFRPTLCIDNYSGQLITNSVKGEGVFWNRKSAPDFSLMDISEFAQEDSSYVLYENFVPNRIISNTPPEFPNLMVSNNDWGKNNYDVTFTKDIVVNGNFEILGDVNILLNKQTKGDITVQGNLILLENNNPVAGDPSGGGAQVEFQNNGQKRILTVFGDILNNSTSNLASNGGLIKVRYADNSSPITHEINLYGSYIQNSEVNNSGLRLYAANSRDQIVLNLLGNDNAVIKKNSGADPVLYRLVVDKGSDQSTNVEITTDFTLNGATNGTVKALELRNGTLNLNNNGIDINLTTWGDDFKIPSTACLQVSQGKVRASGNNTGIALDGKLLIQGGTVDMISGYGNGNNYIEYSSSGNASIDISSGNLWIGSQLRRNLITEAGVLSYKQSGGTTRVGARSAGVSQRAMFEVLNTNSYFSMSDGTLTVIRSGGEATYGDLYLRPHTSSITGGKIIFNPDASGTNQNYLFDANIPVHDLSIESPAGRNANVKLIVSPLTINGDFRIEQTTCSFDVNTTFNIPITMKGNFHNNGNYNCHANLTTFNGNAQSITGTSSTEFFDLTVAPITSLTLNKDAVIYNKLLLSRGTLICGDKKVFVKGNVNNNANYTDNNSGIELDGVSLQYLGGTGTWGSLELNNTEGARLTSNITLQKDLLLTKGIMDINRYLLTLGENSNVVGTNYGSNKMIISDGAYSNAGIKKVYGTYSGVDRTDIIPMGTSGKYTPAYLTYSSISHVGTIRINNVNRSHPGVLDAANVLQYYWEVESFGIDGFTGNLKLSYLNSDVAGTRENEYVAARLLTPKTSWSKASAGTSTDMVDETNDLITFTYSGSNNLSGEYTAGIDDAIPINVPEYTSKNTGNWSNNNNWENTGGDAYPCPVGGPNGFIVTIDNGHTITTDANYASTYKTIIKGTLKISNTTYGHNLGTIKGDGVLYLEKGTMPAGRYSEFLNCSSNATLEYGGTNIDYTIIADLYNTVPNLVFSGTGTRILPAIDLTICKKLEINDAIVNNAYNRKLTILGTFEKNASGQFISGIGDNATVSFQGTSAQTIGASLRNFTGVNSFNNLEINNAAGLTIDNGGAIEVKGKLLLTQGLITSSNTNSLTITNTSENSVIPVNGSSNSYVNGPLVKKINLGDSFTFPVGKGNVAGNKIKLTSTQSGPQLWTVEFFTPNTNATNIQAPLTYVNADEYWKVTSDEAGKAFVNLGWDATSDLTPLMTANGMSDMRVASYDTGNSKWTGIASSASGNDNMGTVTTSDRVTIPSAVGVDFTTACTKSVRPRAQLAPTGAVCGNAGIPVVFTYSQPIPFNYVLTYSIDGVEQAPVTITATPYTLPTNSSGTYKLTSFKYNNGTENGVVDPTEVVVSENPTVADAGANQSYCGATSTVLDGNTPVVGVGLWSIVSGTGGSIVNPSNPTSAFNGTNGTTYNLRWTITNGNCESSDDVTISFPLQAQQPSNFIESKPEVCPGETNVIYTVPDDPSVTYNWSYSGANVTINGTTNSVALDFADNATSGKLSVTATNVCNTSDPRTIDVVVNVAPVANNQSVEVCSDNVGESTIKNIDLTSLHTLINGATGVTYTWYSDQDLSSEITNPDNVVLQKLINEGEYSATEDYYCVVYDGKCSTVAKVVYIINRIPETGPTYHLP